MGAGFWIGISIAIVVVIIAIILIIYFTLPSDAPTTTPPPVVDTLPPTVPPDSQVDREIDKALADTYGFIGANAACDGCGYGDSFLTSTADCRAIGGAWNGTPGDADQVECHMKVGRAGTYGLGPPSRCSRVVNIRTYNPACRALGGVPDTRFGDTTMAACQMSLCDSGAPFRLASNATIPNRGPIFVGTASQAQCNALGGVYQGSATDQWKMCQLSIV